MEFTNVNEKLNRNSKKLIFVVDNFYENPDNIRNFALKQEFVADINYYKGRRTRRKSFVKDTKSQFEKIIGQPIVDWETHGMNGKFQICNSEDALVYHTDHQYWAGMVYLSPNAPFETGTTLYAHKDTKIRYSEDITSEVFKGGFYDSTKFEVVDVIGNVYNRLGILHSQSIHAASCYFGQTNEDSRLFHMFFFD